MARSAESKEVRFSANAVSRGIGIGRVVFPSDTPSQRSDDQKLAESDVHNEVLRFENAVAQATAALTELAEVDPTGIFGVQLLILEDSFPQQVAESIKTEKVVAEKALRTVSNDLVITQRAVADSYIGEKYIDIQDVTDRLLRALAPNAESDQKPTGMIYVVDDVTPSRLLDLARSHPKGLISSQGGWTSHTSILGRELQLPIVSGFDRGQLRLSQGDVVIVDAVDGEIIAFPTRQTVREYRRKKRSLNKESGYPAAAASAHSTADGRSIVIRVNANTREAYERAKRAGACGVGLFRSEGLIGDDGSLPSEQKQYEAYCEIGRLAGDDGVRIRTFDIGVDQLSGNGVSPVNPALGLRAVRLALKNDEIFRTQVRAILRAAAHHRLDIVLPMVSGPDDVLRLKTIIDAERTALTQAGLSPGDPKIGVMVEVPSAVMTANLIARHVDLLCLGTNDLVQYLLAADRNDPSVAEWYQTLHPAVIRSVREVLAAGQMANCPVTVCGEMAGSPFYVPLLIGLGAQELSMNSNSVEEVRRLVSQLDAALCVDLAHRIAPCETADEVAEGLRTFYRKHWTHLFSPSLLV